MSFRPHPDSELTDPKPKRQKRRDDVLSSLNTVIEGLNLAGNLSSITPAKVAFGTVSVILTMIRVSFPILCGDILQADQTHEGLDI